MTPSPAHPATPASERDTAPERDTPEAVEAREPPPLYTKAGETRPDVLRLYDAAQRFIQHFFRNDHDRPRIGIPARPDYDDDLVLLAGIRQLANERDEARAALLRADRPAAPGWRAKALDAYDAGLLSDWGGGNVDWWWDYIRQELGRAHDHYEVQVAACIEPAPSEAGWRDKLATLRADGWAVAVHNDYRLNGKAMTFWLLTRPHAGGIDAIKGEGATDDEALTLAMQMAGLPPPPASPEPSADSVIERVEKRIRQGVRTAPNRFSINPAPPEPQTAPASEDEAYLAPVSDYAGEQDEIDAYVDGLLSRLSPDPSAPAPASDPVRSAALRLVQANDACRWPDPEGAPPAEWFAQEGERRIAIVRAWEALRAALAQNGGEERG